jgi:type I restriction enzyme M protein
LSGDIRQGNTYYEDLHDCPGKFDYVLANPPFNVSKVDKERIADDPRYEFGLPRTDNANYLWIQHFHAALNENGRAGFVMANSASDARASEQEIREKLIKSGHVDVMVSIGSNFFFTVALPCTLWFMDKAKAGTDREDTVLFIDARHIYRQLDRAHRDFTPPQIEFLANIVRLYRGEEPEFDQGSEDKIRELFTPPSLSGRGTGGEGKPGITYGDVPGLCKVATRAEIEAQGWSLNPGRYVGVAKGEEISDEDFKEKLELLNEELEILNSEARELEEKIAINVTEVLDAS